MTGCPRSGERSLAPGLGTPIILPLRGVVDEIGIAQGYVPGRPIQYAARVLKQKKQDCHGAETLPARLSGHCTACRAGANGAEVAKNGGTSIGAAKQTKRDRHAREIPVKHSADRLAAKLPRK
jgi:hypothetical protein